jgi:hypothetical protein
MNGGKTTIKATRSRYKYLLAPALKSDDKVL